MPEMIWSKSFNHPSKVFQAACEDPAQTRTISVFSAPANSQEGEFSISRVLFVVRENIFLAHIFLLIFSLIISLIFSLIFSIFGCYALSACDV